MTSIDLPIAADTAADTATTPADTAAHSAASADAGSAADTAAHSTPAGVARRRLRLVLAANAATSLAAGLVGAVAAGWVADLLDVGSTAWVRGVAIALVFFALDVAWLARAACADRLRSGAALVSAVDLAWVGATAVLVAAGAFGAVGTAVAVVMGVGVLDFALLQLHLRRRSA